MPIVHDTKSIQFYKSSSINYYAFIRNLDKICKIHIIITYELYIIVYYDDMRTNYQ